MDTYHIEPEEPWQEHDTAPNDYETLYQTKPQRKKWPWVLLALGCVLLVAGLVVQLLHFPQVHLTRTPGGFTLRIGREAEPELPGAAPAKTPDEETSERSPAPAPFSPGGQTLRIAPSQKSAEYFISDEPGALSLQEIYLRVLPSVVTVTASGSTGTGIIMSQDGYIITNQHVVDGAREYSVQLTDDSVLPATLVGSDSISDLAVLKIAADNLSAAEFGDSDLLRVGDLAVAIGSPLGTVLRDTMTSGIISGISRDLNVSGRKMTLIQTTAALNNGNSGGPLINCYGQVVGINTMKLSSVYSSATVEALGFAIPVATAKPIVDELIEKGYVSGRPALGVTTETLPLRTRFYYNLPEGAYVVSVFSNSDAHAKGLRTGDIITAVGDVSVSDSDALAAAIADYSAGDTVLLTVFRGGRNYLAEVVLMDQNDFT